MIKVSSNATQVFANLTAKFKTMDAQVNDKLLRIIADGVIKKVVKRIHVEGKKADDSPIGTYSNAYMKIRTGNYSNAGKNDAGFYTKGNKSVYSIKTQKAVKTKESKRKNYNRSDDTKIIFSLTGNMESQFVVIPTAKGYGLGWLDPLNPKKAEGLQFGNKTLKGFGIVYKLTQSEKDSIQPIINDFIKDHIK